jgi:hypothetical protein
VPNGFSITVDSKDLQRKLAAFPGQVRFATARALTATASAAVKDLQTEMKRVFANPTPFTLRATYVKSATKADLTAWVQPRVGSGRPASTWLSPEILGGPRNQKAFEKSLAVISGNQFALPGKDAKLDQYGNLSRSTITQILSRVGAMADPQAVAMSPRVRARLERLGLITRQGRSDMFVGRERTGGRVIGIYQLIAPGRVAQLIRFTPTRPVYKARLPFDAVVEASAAKHWPGAISTAVDSAIATAKLK